MSNSIENMAIWNAERHTPKSKTKKVSQRGGYTAINPQYQLERGTIRWGTYGEKWGVRILSTDFINVAEKQIVWVLGEFYYPGTDGKEASFHVMVDQTLKAGDDVAKKVTTSIRSKALSHLGFSSDVYEGLFDDEKYLADETIREDIEGFVASAMLRIREAKSKSQLDSMRLRILSMKKQKTIDQENYELLVGAIDKAEALLI